MQGTSLDLEVTGRLTGGCSSGDGVVIVNETGRVAKEELSVSLPLPIETVYLH